MILFLHYIAKLCCEVISVIFVVLLSVHECTQNCDLTHGTHTLTLPVHENKRPPYWIFTSGLFLFGMSFCVCVPHFIQIVPPSAELQRRCYFQGGGRPPCSIIIDRPRSVCVVLTFKFYLDRVCSFGNITVALRIRERDVLFKPRMLRRFWANII